MSGEDDVRRDHPNEHVVEYASRGRSSKYHGPPDTLHSRRRDSTHDDTRPRYTQTEELSIQRWRDVSQQDLVLTSNRLERHGRSRDDTGRGQGSDHQLEDTDSGSETERNYQCEQRPQPGHRKSRPGSVQRLREPFAAPRARISGNNPSERPSFKSCLSQLARHFASIEVDEYASCRDFITRYPDILDENENDFVKDAVTALASSQAERVSRPYARRCIQQSLLLRACKQRDRKGREKFFAQLEEEEKKTALDFLKESEIVLERCLEKAQELQEAASLQQPAAATSITQRVESTSRHHSRADDVSQDFGTLNLDSSGRQPQGQGIKGRKTSTNARPSNTSDTQQDRHRRVSIATAGSIPNPNPVVTINRSGLLMPKEGTLINETPGQREELDASYFKREHAARFFILGRVFALLWHQAAGESGNDRFSEDLSHSGRFDERIISHIRRMVVIREGHGKCWAIPINTYRGYGVGKRGFNKYDVDGHAVIHASNTEPYTDPREPAMSKEPLKVNMVKGERLDRMSRINFTTIHTVEHNVKVKHIGMIHPDSKGLVTDYWNAQVAK